MRERQQKKSVKDMKKESEFPFERARRVTSEENQKFRDAISEQFGVKLRKRETIVDDGDEYQFISIRLHPKVLIWAKKEAEKRGVGYQTVINEALLEKIS